MRISKGKPVFGRKDTVGFNTLAEIIHAWLVKFRDDYISRGIYSVPHDLADECGDKAQEKYLEIIDKMIYAFADVEPEYAGEISITSEPIEGSEYHRLHTHVSDQEAWDQYTKDCDEHGKKVEEGLKLFGKYFRSLWV
tara:strand:+ start:50973 stop:51386 length:414 start_codon:yes stop_codon:yes gene_type:complete